MYKEVKSITIIAGDYPASGHMMMVFVQQLVHSMIDKGIKVNVIAPQSIVHSIRYREKLLPRHHIEKTESGKIYDVYRPYILTFGNNNPFPKLTKWINRFSVERIINKIQSEVIYAHFWSNALYAYNYSQMHNIPLFVACGEGDNALENMVEQLPKNELNCLTNAISGVISVSSDNKRKCIEFDLSKEENIIVCPNCVNTELFHKMDVTELKQQLGIGEKDFVISFVGGFISRKGPDRIADAIKKLNDPNIKAIFIGKPFKGYSYDFDCPGIVYKGPLDHKSIPLYVNCSDVFVLPTRKEGCCNAIVEALAMGIPVISSNRPFNDDILNTDNSIRIDPDDVDAIANAIATLRDNRDLCNLMTSYSLSRHNEYTIHKRTERILEFINERI